MLFLVHFPPLPCYPVRFRPKYLPQDPILENSHPMLNNKIYGSKFHAVFENTVCRQNIHLTEKLF